MQHLSILEQSTKNYQHPQEDYLIVLDLPPTFVVSDGVTLKFTKLVENNIKYPNPSPAGRVAKIFCEAVARSVRDKYGIFSAEKIKDVFKEANSEVARYNQKIGRSDISGNITGFYAATGSFVVIKENKVYWASICDAFVAHFDKAMNIKFISSGLCDPYAVINGEERMAEHLESGILGLEKDDRIFVFTDGFECYVKNSDFLALFKNWGNNLEDRIAAFSKKMNVRNSKEYDYERSLIVILI